MAKRKTNLRKKSKCRTKKSGGTPESGQPIEVSPESGQPIEVSPETSYGKSWIVVAAIIALLFFSLMYIFGNDIYSLFTSTPKPKPDDDDKK